MNVALAATLFKFRKIDKRTIESLVFNEIYFSTPGEFNDPFDCKIKIIKSVEQAILMSNTDHKKFLTEIKENLNGLFKKIDDEISGYGVFCGSMNLNNHLMWSHYADSHRGISLAYEIPQHLMDYKQGIVIGISPVDYKENPLRDWFLNISSQKEKYRNFDIFLTDLIVVLLTSKDLCWSYEEEGRIIARKHGLNNIGHTALKQVCFGLKTPERDKELVKNILDKNGYTGIFCEIERDDTDFGIREREVSV